MNQPKPQMPASNRTPASTPQRTAVSHVKNSSTTTVTGSTSFADRLRAGGGSHFKRPPRLVGHHLSKSTTTPQSTGSTTSALSAATAASSRSPAAVQSSPLLLQPSGFATPPPSPFISKQKLSPSPYDSGVHSNMPPVLPQFATAKTTPSAAPSPPAFGSHSFPSPAVVTAHAVVDSQRQPHSRFATPPPSPFTSQLSSSFNKGVPPPVLPQLVAAKMNAAAAPSAQAADALPASGPSPGSATARAVVHEVVQAVVDAQLQKQPPHQVDVQHHSQPHSEEDKADGGYEDNETNVRSKHLLAASSQHPPLQEEAVLDDSIQDDGDDDEPDVNMLRPHQQPDDLPPSWEVLLDKQGTPYYYNHKTGTSSWDPPPKEELDERAIVDILGNDEDDEFILGESSLFGVAATAAATPPVVREASQRPADSGSWDALVDPASGATYYYNRETDETSWKLPTVAATAPERMTPPQQQQQHHSLSKAELEQRQEVGATTAEANDDTKQLLLPPGWEALIDPRSGETYYFHEASGDSSWDPPPPATLQQVSTGDTPVQEPSAMTEPPAAVLGIIQDTYEVAPETTNDSGAAAAFDETVAATSDPVDVSSADSTTLLPPGWEKLVDPSSGDTYYYNQSTDESSWDPPPLALSPEEEPTICDDAAREEAMVEPVINATSDALDDDDGIVVGGEDGEEPLLPPGWEALRDPSSGETYYFHQATGNTSWSPPSLMTSSSALSSAAADVGVDDTTAAIEEEEGAIPEKTQEDIEVADDNNYDYDSTAVEQPDGWEKLVDPDSGETHYLNEGNGDSSGVPPSVAGEPGSGDNVMEETTAIDLPGEPQEMADAFTKVVPDIAGARDESLALPPGWEKLVDPVSGETYYYNEATGDSFWDPPSAQAEDPAAIEPAVNVRDNPKASIAEGADSAEVAIHSAGADELALLPGWERMKDPDSGEIYYNYESAGEGSWDPQSAVAPTDFKANGDSFEEPTDVEPVLDAPEKPEQEIAEVDESTQEVLAEATKSAEIVTDVAVAGVSALPPGWEELTDPNSGETYYYNEASGKSSWDPPSEDPTTGGDAFDEPTTMEPGVDTPEKPQDELTEVAESMEIVADVAVAESSLPPGWKKVTYPDSGDTYFFNEATGESSWDPPSDVAVDEPTTMEPGMDTPEKPQDELAEVAESMEIVADVAVAESSLPPGWKKVIYADSGETYFFNEETGESSWDPRSDVAPTPTSDGDSVDEPFTNEPSVAPNSPEELTESAELALPPGWEKLADPGSGKTYYFNEATGESSWDPPAEAISEEGEPSSGHGMEEEPVIVEPDMSHEDGSEDPKYLLTVGEPPEESIDVDGQKEIEKSTEAALKEGSALSRGWERVEDPDSGEAYYYNEATGETAWELPTAFRDPLVSANNAATGEPAVGESEASEVIDLDGSTGPNDDILPEEWEKIVDPNSGEAYYFKAATGESSWEVPALLEQPSRSLNPASVPVDTQADGPRDYDELDILPGWEKVVDPDSGEAYYYNAASGETSWEIPSAQSSGKDTTTGVQLKGAEYHQRKKQGAGRPAHAIATFAFRGRLCVVRQIIGTKAVVSIHPTCRVVPSNAIVRAENVKKQTGFSGPLNLADETSVTAFVDRNGLKGRDLLWDLVAICAKSRGRLRCDSRIDATDGPEMAIVNLLLHDNENRVGENGTSTSPAKLRQENGNGTALRSHLEGSDLGSVQDHLLRGEREKAVEVALLGGHYAMALLVASMCNRETYYAAAKHYVDSVLLTTSPLHTAAMLFCGHLQAPEEGASTSSFWGVDATALRNNWRCHLAAIISNRTTGWDLIAVSLGDRLRDLGEITPAHFCYMVCGCSVSPPVQGDSKMTLLGCNISPMDVLLMTDVALDGFARTEAYEWAKRRGNRNAAIQSLQGFKLQYAMLLCDLGFVQEAKDYVESIMQRMGDKHEGAAEYRHPAFLSILSADSRSLFSHLIQFRRRLLSRDTRDAGYWGKSQEFEKEQDVTFTTIHSSNEDEPPVPEASALPEFIPPEVKAKKTKKAVKVDRASRKEKAEPHIDKARHASRGSDHNESQPTTRTSILDETAPMDARSVAQRPPEGPKPSFVATQPSLAVPTILPKPVVEELALSTLTTSTAGAATSIPPIVTDKKPGREIVGSIPPFTPKAGSSDRKTDSKPLGIDVSTPKAEPPGVSKIKTAPTSAPANLQSAKSWGMFDFGIKEKITKILNPKAHQADVGQAMEAYYDKKLKVWVFPGEDPVELAKPVGPPPTLMTLQKEQQLSAAPGTATSSLQPKDPLAAMMAPPQRTPARRLPKALPSPSGAVMPPPQFAVFQPKPAAAKADVDDGK